MPGFDDLYLDVPKPSQTWLLWSKADRIAAVVKTLGDAIINRLTVCECEDNGYVYFEFSVPMAASERGVFLLDIEMVLKANLDPGLTVWHVPQGDKSSLRRLRGVSIKT
jgi:hypothetical protein